jgi:hypothetical protein
LTRHARRKVGVSRELRHRPGKLQAYQTYAFGVVLSGGSGRQKRARETAEDSPASIAPSGESRLWGPRETHDADWRGCCPPGARKRLQTGTDSIGGNQKIEEAYETFTKKPSRPVRERRSDPFGIC